MTKENIVRAVAGTFILVGLALATLVSIKWLLLPVFVGFNLLQSSVTHFCPLEIILDKAGIGSGKKAC